MLDWISTLTTEAIGLARLVIVLVAIISVIMTYYKTQALVPVIGAALVAGIAIWAVSPAGIARLEEWIKQDTASAPVVVVIEDPGVTSVAIGGNIPGTYTSVTG